MAEWPRVPERSTPLASRSVLQNARNCPLAIQSSNEMFRYYIQTALSQPAEEVLSELFHQFHSWDKVRKAFTWLLRFNNWFL